MHLYTVIKSKLSINLFPFLEVRYRFSFAVCRLTILEKKKKKFKIKQYSNFTHEDQMNLPKAIGGLGRVTMHMFTVNLAPNYCAALHFALFVEAALLKPSLSEINGGVRGKKKQSETIMTDFQTICNSQFNMSC